ncbi:MAG: hypothetical protein QOH49_4712 [Acidobacteriota bacterium]|jgi:uncharacterized protein (DUF1800 family)|nr:hypothetical protein [Acidobacteriota bacterium]
MKERSSLRAYARVARWLCVVVFLSALAAAAGAQTLPPGSPVLLTEGTGQTTRAVAYEAVTFRSEPFPVASAVNWNADKTNTRDQQTRVMLFAFNLPLLAGEGANALTADAQDASGRLYPLKVEALLKPAYDIFDLTGKQHVAQPQDWLWAVTLRLDDAMTDTLGDVLVRINLHGLSSNRVRIAIGQTGSGIANDPATEFLSPAPPTPPAPTPTPTPKAFGANESNDADVVRLLEQASWGPTPAEVARVKSIGIRAFIDEQFNAPVLNTAKTSDYPDLATVVDDNSVGCPVDTVNDPNNTKRNACLRDNYTMYPLQVQFFKNVLTRPGQLRQRVAFALHQIFVVSGRDIPLPWWMNGYLQTLDKHALGNYRTLLAEMTLNPSMGEYLNMNQSVATNFNENYAREVLQLFSMGVNRLKHDGTPVLDAQGLPVPVYTQSDVDEFTRVFTGWNFNRAPSPALPAGTTNYRDPMVPRGGTTHDRNAKNLFGTALAGCPGTNGATNSACAQNELNAALDVIFNHPNTAPFISRQLIQHLVTSNPSPAYVARVADAFDNDCAGLYPESPCFNTRGNMKAVVRNILLDPEARGDVKTDPTYGKLREPVQYINNFLRAFNATSDGVIASNTNISGGDAPNQMGQPLFLPATVFSYYEPDHQVTGTRLQGPAFQILTTSTTLRRANFINQLLYFGIQPTGGTFPNVPTGTQIAMTPVSNLSNDPPAMAEYLNTLLLHGTMSAAMKQTVVDAINAIPTSSSDAARRRAQTAIYLVATSAQYEVQR